MNNESKKVFLVTTTDVIQRHRESLDTASENYIQNEVKPMANNLAINNVPEKTASNLEFYIEPIRSFYNRLLSDTALELGSNIREKLGAMDVHALNEKIKAAKLRLNTLKEKLKTTLERDKVNSCVKTSEDFRAVKRNLIIFSCIEVLSFFLVFLGLEDSVLLSLVMALLFGSAYTFGIKALVLWMRDGAGSKLSKPVKITIWVLVAIVAAGFGLLRYWLVQSNGNETVTHSLFAPLVFVLMSWFLIAVLALYVAHYYPTPDEELAMREMDERQQKILELKNEISTTEKQIEDLQAELKTIAQIHTLLIQAEKDFYLRTTAHFQNAVGVFKYTNRINRTDNHTPDCFNVPVASLALPNYDQFDALPTSKID